MHSASYYDKVKDLISKEDFEDIIKKLDEEFDNLLDREILEYLIVDEMGRNKKSIVPISEVKPNRSCTVFGMVMEKIVSNKNIKLIISDNTSSCSLNLWDNNAEIGRCVQIGDVVKVVNGHAKFGEEGIEINAGRWSLLEINPKDAPSIKIKPVFGVLIEKDFTEVKFDNNGNVRFFKRIQIKDNSNIYIVNVWDDHVKLINGLKIGEFVTIENPVRKLISGKLEIEARAASRITTKS